MLLITTEDLADCDRDQRVRVTRVLVYEGSAHWAAQVLNAPGAYLTQAGQTKNGVTELTRTVEVLAINAAQEGE